MRQRLSLFVTVLTLAGALAGCRPKLPADPDAILYYFRNARVQGEVKRAWPEGQTYVDDVLRADTKVQRELNSAVAAAGDLWPAADPRWKDQQLVAEQAEALSKLVDQGQDTRGKVLAELQKAIENVPASLNLSGEAKTAFVEEVWKSLALEGWWRGASVRDAERECQELLKIARDAYRKPRTGIFGGTFGGAYSKLARRLTQRHEDFLSYAERELTATRPPATNGREERHHVYRRAYLRKQLEALPKSISASIETTEREVKELKRPLPAPFGLVGSVRSAVQEELDFREELLKRLRAQHEELKARVDEILKKSKAAAG